MRTNRNRIEFDEEIVRRYPLKEWDIKRLEVTAGLHEAARTAGLPVPAILAVHPEGPHPHLVMQRAAGAPLMETSLPDPAQVRLGGELARIVALMRTVRALPDRQPSWSVLWAVLARMAPTAQCRAAAQLAGQVTTNLVHGDLSPGNLLVTEDGDLVAILDWDGAALADVAMDWAALCANCPPLVVRSMRSRTPDAAELDHRAEVYLSTWPTQHDLWLAGDHPWLSGDRPLAEPRT